MSAGFTTVTASYLQDATGQPLGNATIFFTPVLSARAGGPQGQIVASPISAQVIGGAFTLQLADTAATNPSPSAYSVALIDNLSGASLLGPGYGNVQPTGANWNFDAYVPAQAAVAPYTQGPPGTPGPAGASSISPGFINSLITSTLASQGTIVPYTGQSSTGGGTPPSTQTVGTLPSPSFGTTATQGVMQVTQTAAIGNGHVQSCQVRIAVVDPSGYGEADLCVFSGSGMTFQVVARVTVSFTVAGVRTFTAGTDFDANALPIAPGQYVGFQVDDAGSSFANGDNGSILCAYHVGDIGIAPAAFSQGGAAGMVSVIAYAGTAGGAYGFIQLNPFTSAGYLDAIELNIGEASGGTIFLLVYAETSPGHFQQVWRLPVTVSASGLQTFSRGAAFLDIPVGAGQFTGVLFPAGCGVSMTVQSGGTNPAGYSFLGDPGAAIFAASAENNAFDMVASVRSYVAPLTSSQVSALIASSGGGGGTTTATASYGTLPSLARGNGNNNGGSPQIIQEASTQNGYVTQSSLTIGALTSGPGTVALCVFTGSGMDFQVLHRVTVPVTATGVVNWNAGTDFGATALPIAPGQFVGYIPNGSATIVNGDTGTILCAYYGPGGDPGSGSVGYNQGGGCGQTFVVTYTVSSAPSGVTAAQISSGSIPIPMSSWSLYAGGKFAVFGNSLAETNTQYNGSTGNLIWQQEVANVTGMTWKINDAVAGTGWANLLASYPGISLTNLNATRTQNNYFGGIIGNTLAQDLADVAEIIIWTGQTDLINYALGTPTDTVTAGTVYGYVNNVLAILTAAAPQCRVSLIGSYISVGAAGTQAVTLTHETVMLTAGQHWGARLLSLIGASGFNAANNQPLYLTPASGGAAGTTPNHPSVIGEARLSKVIARAFMAS